MHPAVSRAVARTRGQHGAAPHGTPSLHANNLAVEKEEIEYLSEPPPPITLSTTRDFRDSTPRDFHHVIFSKKNP